MTTIDRRNFIRLAGGAGAAALFPASIRKALAIPAAVETGTIDDVKHVVILMQENRSFDHYFGTFPGVRGFGDRFTIPMPGGRTVWEQKDALGVTILPYHLDAALGNAQRVAGTPHGFTDAHLAWNKGRLGHWPAYKQRQSMGHYGQAEVDFQFALASAFTLCDAYHCAIHSSTNPNRLYMFSGTNDPFGKDGGPAIDNSKDSIGPAEEGYTWTTYAERLEAAGVTWKVYQDMADNFTDNSLAGFRTFRDAYVNDPSAPIIVKGLSTTLTNNDLDGLRHDVLSGGLPQVSWVVGPAVYSEHPGPSSPVQGAWYVQEVLDALTADPEVWSRTVLLVMFDENDGFFDHVPSPAAASRNGDGSLAGASTVDDATERHTDGEVYGPGPRVPMWVVSPWSRGGWVNSEVFDHTSILRFLEKRFGIVETNISAWRRTVCGDLASAFNFADPNGEPLPTLPRRTREEADQIRSDQEALPPVPIPTGAAGTMPQQAIGTRPSRALPYRLRVACTEQHGLAGSVRLDFQNTGSAGAVFQVYDRRHLALVPRRYTVEAGKSLSGTWIPGAGDFGRYDLWVLGPNGFHRSYAGRLETVVHPLAARPQTGVTTPPSGGVVVTFANTGGAACTFTVAANAYRKDGPWTLRVEAGGDARKRFHLAGSGQWYDFTVTVDSDARFERRFAGRTETGEHGVSDPAMGG